MSCGGARGSRALNTRSADRDPIDPIAYTHTHRVTRRLISVGKAVKLERARSRRRVLCEFFLELAREMERDGDGEDPLVDFLTRLVRVILLGPGWRIL